MALHGQHLSHLTISCNQLLFPICKTAIDFFPVIERASIVNLHPNLSELLLIIGLSDLGHDFLLVDVLLQGQQYLSGIDRFDKVVGNLTANGLIHNVLLFALGNHNHRNCGKNFLNAGKRFQAIDTRHVLVKKNKVIGRLGTLFEGIIAIRHGIDLIAFLFQEQDVGLQQFYLIVYPKEFICSHIFLIFSNHSLESIWEVIIALFFLCCFTLRHDIIGVTNFYLCRFVDEQVIRYINRCKGRIEEFLVFVEAEGRT